MKPSNFPQGPSMVWAFSTDISVGSLALTSRPWRPWASIIKTTSSRVSLGQLMSFVPRGPRLAPPPALRLLHFPCHLRLVIISSPSSFAVISRSRESSLSLFGCLSGFDWIWISISRAWSLELEPGLGPRLQLGLMMMMLPVRRLGALASWEWAELRLRFGVGVGAGAGAAAGVWLSVARCLGVGVAFGLGSFGFRFQSRGRVSTSWAFAAIACGWLPGSGLVSSRLVSSLACCYCCYTRPLLYHCYCYCLLLLLLPSGISIGIVRSPSCADLCELVESLRAPSQAKPKPMPATKYY